MKNINFKIIICCLLMAGCQKNTLYRTTGYVEGNLIYLSAPQGGYLQDLFINIGQNVKKGQLLLKLNPQPQQSNVEIAHSKLKAAQEYLYELQKSKDTISKYKINIAKLEVDEALANLRANKWAAETKNISAPLSGEINDILYQQNEYIPPQHPIISLFVKNNMKIVFYIPEVDLNKIKVDTKISILLQNRTYPSKIFYIAPQAEYTPEAIFSERNRYKLVYKVKAEIPATLINTIKPGQPLEINYE